ncbi:MAG TPA: Maf family protein, partial [Acidimicrobiales bacterium]|nr:Maf family protein [Acidimicrobiales bacterium]
MAVTPRLVLASASPARLQLLRGAGFEPTVVVSGVEEAAPGLPTAEAVEVIAVRKASAVAAGLSDALVIGCDSLLDVDGVGCGKPGSAAAAAALWRSLRGRSATLCTGHCIIDTRTGTSACAVATTVVRFGSPTEEELDAYVATGEPLAVAGAFTIEGYGAPFVEGIDGDASNVIGLSLPLFRSLLAQLGVAITDLWRAPGV